jgi:hypothetical protein
MSQINDALKRAKDVQPKDTPSSVPPMLPVESETRQHGANWIWPVVIILLLLLLAGLFIAISAGSRLGQKAAAEPAPAPAVQAAAPVPAPKPPVAAPAAQSTAPKPALVQGIVYDPANPYAIIGGKTVFVGDTVGAMHVTAISPDAVTLVGNGQTKQLRVGQR